jgi:phage host-nuclease inhibitor protein Gam
LQPTLAPDITQFFIPIRGKTSGETYLPMLIGAARVRFADNKAGVDEVQDVVYLTAVTDQPIPVDWEAAQEAGFSLNDLERGPARGVLFGELPGIAGKSRNYVEWTKDFVSWVYGNQKLELLRSPSTGQVSTTRESERDFRVRLQQATREQRDEQVEQLSKKYAPKIAALKEKIRKAEQAVDREADQAKSAGVQTALSFGSTLLGAFLGRKKISSSTIGKAATSMKSASRTAQQKADVDRAKETVKAYQEQLDELNTEFEEESKTLESKIDPSAEELETVVFRPKKTDIDVQLVSLVWAPYTQDERGKATPGW